LKKSLKLLLDENLPKRLKEILSPHEVFTVRDMGWNGIKNGQLLKLMITNGFDALLTFDKNLQYQQNFEKSTIPVIVLNAADNSFITLSKLKDKIHQVLNSELRPGPNEVK
jgi:hypothetical protein